MFRNKKTFFILAAVLVVLVFGYYNQGGEQISNFDSENNLKILEAGNLAEKVAAEEVNESIVVHLAGAVKNAGVYKLDKDDRLIDLIKAAGGLKDNADLAQINLAEKLNDGQKVTVAEKTINGEKNAFNNLKAENSEGLMNNSYSSSNHSMLININQADQSQLEKLSGIGPSKAAAIIKYRNENSYFSQKEDLLKISGIGEKTLENIRDEIALQ